MRWRGEVGNGHGERWGCRRGAMAKGGWWRVKLPTGRVHDGRVAATTGVAAAMTEQAAATTEQVAATTEQVAATTEQVAATTEQVGMMARGVAVEES